MTKPKELELLAPAANAETGRQAILHGADAVYIGATSHGARKNAANSIEDIAELAEFAHRYRAKVYVTVNTIVYDSELKEVEKLCRDLYRAGVDALIVQDMALLRLDLPPIALHASTQCDIRTPEKARFLQEAGMSQLVLARELTLPEIKDIVKAVDIPVECFVHGALCVSYSGVCHASAALTGRSANRGECAQVCRWPFTLRDGDGKVLARDKHLLSLKDFNACGHLDELVDAGVSSFKIEGRLKDIPYVKNITSLYSGRLNGIIASSGGAYRRSSFGECEVAFVPKADKSFNRGFTDYFLSSRRPGGLATPATPKSLGEEAADIGMLRNGDGISYFDSKGMYTGTYVNGVSGNRILTSDKGTLLFSPGMRRTFDVEWEKLLAKETAKRTVWVDIEMDESGITARDERGAEARVALDVKREKAEKPMDYKSVFQKTGGTVYRLREFKSKLPSDVFIPRSELTALRRDLIALLDKANEVTYEFAKRRLENRDMEYCLRNIDYRGNVSNELSRLFYTDHGANVKELAIETQSASVKSGTVIMTTRHCVLRELGLCKRLEGRHIKGPLTITSGKNTLRLHFNCADCEMEVLK